MEDEFEAFEALSKIVWEASEHTSAEIKGAAKAAVTTADTLPRPGWLQYLPWVQRVAVSLKIGRIRYHARMIAESPDAIATAVSCRGDLVESLSEIQLHLSGFSPASVPFDPDHSDWGPLSAVASAEEWAYWFFRTKNKKGARKFTNAVRVGDIKAVKVGRGYRVPKTDLTHDHPESIQKN